MTDLSLFRVYEPHELGSDGYPKAWHSLATGQLSAWCEEHGHLPSNGLGDHVFVGIKDLVRAEAGHRCVRCGHPYTPGCGEWQGGAPAEDHRAELALWEDGQTPSSTPVPEPGRATLWSPCDAQCTHSGPWGVRHYGGGPIQEAPTDPEIDAASLVIGGLLAPWRILTVHHLNERKFDCRWWNLASLCQRCHLHIQKKVQMERVFPWEHTAWFQPFAAGWYAYAYLGESLTQAEAAERQDELLGLERVA